MSELEDILMRTRGYDLDRAKEKIKELFLELIGNPDEITVDRPRYEVPKGAKYMEFPRARGMEKQLFIDELRQKVEEL